MNIAGFMFLVSHSWFHITGFIFQALYSRIGNALAASALLRGLALDCFIFLVLYSWFYILGFIFLALYSWFYIPSFRLLFFIPGFIFQDWECLGGRFYISDFRFQISGFRFQISNFRFRSSDARGTGLLRPEEPHKYCCFYMCAAENLIDIGAFECLLQKTL